MSRLAQAERAQSRALESLARKVARLGRTSAATIDERREIVDLFVELGFDDDSVLVWIERLHSGCPVGLDDVLEGSEVKS